MIKPNDINLKYKKDKNLDFNKFMEKLNSELDIAIENEIITEFGGEFLFKITDTINVPTIINKVQDEFEKNDWISLLILEHVDKIWNIFIKIKPIPYKTNTVYIKNDLWPNPDDIFPKKYPPLSPVMYGTTPTIY